MNELSWLLYAASVFDDLKGLLIFLRICGILGLIVITIVGFTYQSSRMTFNQDGKTRQHIRRQLRWYIPLLLCVWFVAILVPSSNTVYAIAASQVGEQALNAWLDRQINLPKATDN